LNFIIIIPAVIACVLIARKSARAALLDVYLPVLMLLPIYFVFRIKHLPPLTFADAAILPIGIAMLCCYARQWKFRRADLWVALFILSAALAEARHTGLNNGGLQLFAAITSVAFPYIAGRLLIEQYGLRLLFLKRFIILLFAVAFICLYDFAAGTSAVQSFWSHILTNPISLWHVQMRWGFARATGPYGQAILAGMMFLIGIIFCLCLRGMDPKWGTRRVFSFSSLTVRTALLLGCTAGILLAQSRGPWMGAALGIAVVSIGRARNMKRATVVVVLLAIIATVFTWNYLADYTSGTIATAANLEQQNAVYRRELFNSYAGIVQKGGVIGWGISDYPKAHGQDSIDNQYLLLAVTQGYLGLTAFLLLCGEILLALVRQLRRSAHNIPERWFLFGLLASFVGILLTATTVFLGEQVFPLFFLLAGWAFTVCPVRERSPLTVTLPRPRFALRRVFT
jgi:hypothetical protein